MLSLALYQPDIPQNVGALMRLTACLDVALSIIEPCGFPWDEKKIKQAAMDYMTFVNYRRHISWDHFRQDAGARRIVLMTTKAGQPYTAFRFRPDDIVLAGSESKGVPDNVHRTVDAALVIPMREGLRSLNIANASAMVLGEALRQIRYGFKDGAEPERI